MPGEIKKAQTATQSLIGVTMGLAAAISILNKVSPIGIWSIINLFQMLMLLTLTGAFIPQMVRQYLIGMDFVLLSFNFIPLIKVPPFSDAYSMMKFKQQNKDLIDIGIEYGSAIINNIQLCAILIILIAFHMLICIINMKTKSKTGK